MMRRRFFVVSMFALTVAMVGAIAMSLDARVVGLMRNTFYLAVGTCAVSLPIGTLLALAVVKTNLPGRAGAAVLLATMLFVPLYLQAGAWLAGFGSQGWYTLAERGGQGGSQAGPAEPLLAGWRGAIWIHAMAAVPWVALIVGLGLWLVEPELEEDALLDAAAGRVFGRVTLRRAGGAVLLAGLWVAIATAGQIVVTDLLMIRTYAEEVYTEINLGGLLPSESPLPGLDWGDAGGLWPGVMVTLLLAVVALVVCRRLAPDLNQVSGRRPLVWRLGRWRWPAACGVWSMVLVIVGVPAVNLLYKAGVDVTQGEAGRLREWSLGKAAIMIAKSPSAHGLEIGWSVLIGAVAATSAVVLAAGLAWLARRRAGAELSGWALPALVVTAVCLAMPSPIVGLGVIRLMNASGADTPEWVAFLYDRTILPPVLVQMARSLPLAVLILWYAVWTLPQAMLDSAASEGAGLLRRLVWIVVPNRWASILVAWLVCFALCLGELGATMLVVPPGITPLSVRICCTTAWRIRWRRYVSCLAAVFW